MLLSQVLDDLRRMLAVGILFMPPLHLEILECQ